MSSKVAFAPSKSCRLNCLSPCSKARTAAILPGDSGRGGSCGFAATGRRRAAVFRDIARFGAEALAEAFGLALCEVALEGAFFRGATFLDWDRALPDATEDAFLGFGAAAIRFAFRLGEVAFLVF